MSVENADFWSQRALELSPGIELELDSCGTPLRLATPPFLACFPCPLSPESTHSKTTARESQSQPLPLRNSAQDVSSFSLCHFPSFVLFPTSIMANK